MNLVYLPQESLLVYVQTDDRTYYQYGPPNKMKVEGRDIELNLQTRVALTIDLARTVGCDKIIFPFNSDDEIKITRTIMRNYRDQGYFMDYQFPRKV